MKLLCHAIARRKKQGGGEDITQVQRQITTTEMLTFGLSALLYIYQLI